MFSSPSSTEESYDNSTTGQLIHGASDEMLRRCGGVEKVRDSIKLQVQQWTRPMFWTDFTSFRAIKKALEHFRKMVAKQNVVLEDIAG